MHENMEQDFEEQCHCFTTLSCTYLFISKPKIIPGLSEAPCTSCYLKRKLCITGILKKKKKELEFIQCFLQWEEQHYKGEGVSQSSVVLILCVKHERMLRRISSSLSTVWLDLVSGGWKDYGWWPENLMEVLDGGFKLLGFFSTLLFHSDVCKPHL